MENRGPLQPGCHSLLRPELLTQYRTVISTICRSDCLYFPVLTWIQRFSTRLNAPSCFPPETRTPPPPPLRCPSPPASPHRSFPLHFKNCSHMSEGTPGSNTSRKQHYYLQLTFNFKCIKRDGAIVQGEGGREDRED